MDPLQGVFINPAIIEPFGLTLIEVLYSLFVTCVYFMTRSCHLDKICFFFPSRLQLMVYLWLLQKMVVL